VSGEAGVSTHCCSLKESDLLAMDSSSTHLPAQPHCLTGTRHAGQEGRGTFLQGRPQTSKEGEPQQLSSPGEGESSRAGTANGVLRNALFGVIIIGQSPSIAPCLLLWRRRASMHTFLLVL
jgi:hypothetical protein